MEISRRLKMVADEVHNADNMADIGTDHGYVPIYLYKNGKIKRAIACDINKGPLNKAAENILAYGAEKVIETRLGNGLVPIEPGEADVIVIAGMGGMLTIDILENSKETIAKVKQMVLQPQLDIDKVRRYIHSIGFKIENEEMIIEDKKYYTIISAVPGNEIYTELKDYIFGKVLIKKKHPVLRQYIDHRIDKQNELIQKLKDSNTIKSTEKLRKIEEENKMYKEVYLCL